ncbi:23S rRNA methyltransferase [Kouleothrix aurantiaca]|uniref:23S rRNA methyltransferase n=1 Tax=Kouleothrix aurantiaca TaxID=186479 RepID=A0A0P9D5I8_9CHLR|nr:23S rRNA methyltransferase [Kouleothrix aurantiaca]
MATITLNPGKDRPVQQRHPWIFSGAIKGVQGYVGRGDAVDVCGADGEWLARGTWSSGSQIRVRLFTWDADEALDETLLRRRLERAIATRAWLGYAGESAACRLVYAESDGLPGLIVDRYGPYLAVQLLTQGMAARAETISRLLADLLQPRGIYERSDPDMREKESLPPGEGVLWGEPPPEQIRTEQPGGLAFLADLRAGQKTGAYLDQAHNRLRVAAYCAGQNVLDCFCYTGGFSIAAARDGAASVIAADTSAPALAMLGANADANGVAGIEPVEADVFKLLRQYRHENRQFDVIILDPPKFAHANNQIERATRGYKDINLIAMQLLRPGGVLATFSCSGLVSADLFQKVVFGAALDAHRDVQVIERLTQSPDHPVLLTFPEGEYLKGLICRVL